MIPLQKLQRIRIAYRMMTSTRSMLTGCFLVSSFFAANAQPGLAKIPLHGTQFEASAEAEAIRSSTLLPPAELTVAPVDGQASHTAEGDARIAKADLHFNDGRRMYFEGDLAGARKEFDAAVDVLLGAPENLADHRRLERRLEEICDLVYRFDVEKLGSGKGQEEAVVFDKAPIDEVSHMTFPVDPNLANRLKSELNQTSSGIPLELADPVLSYVHYFSSERGRKILLSGIQRSGRYREMILRVLREEGVPEDLIYLAQAESGFLPRAVSNKNAVGMWQFIAGTGSVYQLNRTAVYDERLDPEKATRAAARFLRDLYSRYGDWYLAIAAYNCGAGAVDRAVERTGYADYWELLKRHALPRETSNYVPIILAMTIIGKNPQDYGLDNIQLENAVDYDTIQLTAPTNLNLIADATMQPISVVRDLNPALLRTVAPVGFEVHVPKGASDVVQAALESVPAGNRQAWRLHHVLAGDTLSTIAKNYHVTPDSISSVNPAADSIAQGDVLLIPAVYHEETPARRSVVARTTRHGLLSASTRSRAHGVTASAHTSHVAASHHVSAQALHRKAALHTASLQR
jgi:membrane-bound lytic murein transglycosylase D